MLHNIGKHIRILLLIVISAIAMSCTTESEHILDFSSLSEVTIQIFELNGTRDTTIYGEQGTQILFPAGAICPMYGDKSPLKVELKEYYFKADMLLGGLTTLSNNRPLESKGMIHLNVTISDQEIKSLCTPIRIKFQNPIVKQDYNIFMGNALNDQINWTINPSQNYHVYANYNIPGSWPIYSDLPVLYPIMDSLEWDKGYSQIDTIITFTESPDTVYSWDEAMAFDSVIESDTTFESDTTSIFYIQNQFFQTSELGWINCDRFLELSNLTSLTVNTNMDNASSYIVFENINSILFNYGDVVSNIPIGEEVIIVSLYESEGDYFLGIREKVVVREDMEVNVILEKTTKQAIQSMVKEALN